jgi:hypothetical protein
MATRPIETRVQDVVYSLDAGQGLRAIQVGLAVAAVFFILVLFQVAQFKGLKEAEAMELAQLGRNVLEQKSFVTQVVRPASMEYLRVGGRTGGDSRIGNHPDLFHAPLYPGLLAAGFAAFPNAFAPGSRGVFPPEQWIMMPLNHLFTIFSGVLVWLIGQRLFSRKIGLLGMLCFFLSRTVWEDSVSGLGLTMVYAFLLAAFYLVLIAAERIRAGEATGRWALPLAAAALACGLAALTRYAALAVVPGLLLHLGLALKRRSALWLPVFLAVLLAVMAPWIVRNVRVCGHPFGLAAHLALNDSRLSEGDTWQRELKPPPARPGALLGAMRAKAIERTGHYLREGLPRLGDGPILWPLFIAAFFFRFSRDEVRRLRWGVLLSMAVLFFAATFWGDRVFRLMTVFWPFIILYGLAFFFVLLDRLQYHLRLANIALTTLVVALTAGPYVFALLPPRAGVPYPPYFPPFVQYITGMIEPGDVLATDMPWGTAWYGRRTSILLPTSVDEFYQINDYRRAIKGVYFTTLTTDKPFARVLLTGPYKSWFPLLMGQLPEDFPLTQGMPLNNRDQLFLTDQLRTPDAGPVP